MTGSPGSHPHIPNWRPAETPDDYLRNCREGSEKYSERRFAKLTGMSRVQLWRGKMMAQIPDALFDRLMRLDPKPQERQLAALGQWLAGGQPVHEVERCPHCGGVTRGRPAWSAAVQDAVIAWHRELGGQ